MAILDLSNVPGEVTITNTSTHDRKVSISGHNQSFILEAGSTVILWAKDSQDLIGYLSQVDGEIEVVIPSTAGHTGD